MPATMPSNLPENTLMNFAALGLVMAAAFIHASWNVLAKKSSAGPAFIWCYTLFSIIGYLPVALWLIYQGYWPSSISLWLHILLSSFLHCGYTICLQRGYQSADLTVVYPVARGTGPLFSAIGAYLLLGETATPFSILGLLVIVSGIGIIAKVDQAFMHRHPALVSGIQYGVATGMFIASYTLVDAYNVKVLALHPILFDYLANSIRFLLLTPNAIKHWPKTKVLIHEKWGFALGIGLLSPLSYFLVLYAVKQAPISIIAPARELSMMIAALIGTYWLKEGHAKRRVLGACLIVIGVVCLAFTH